MERLGKFERVAQIGRGATATVYRGYHPELRAWRALKVFDCQGDAAEQRVREAVLQASINHPGIVQIMDLERDGKLLYLVMELATAGTLRNRLEWGILDAKEAANLARQTAQALAAAHSRGVWHLDLKPENVLIFDDSRAKLADFGLARTAQHCPPGSLIAGTPNYMAPEQFHGHPSARSDLWGWGAMVLEMFTGRLCFAGDTVREVKAGHERGARVMELLRMAEFEVPTGLAQLLHQVLEVNPSQRPESAVELMHQMDAQEERNSPPVNEASNRETRYFVNRCSSCEAPVPLGRDFCPDCAPQSAQNHASPAVKAPESVQQEGRPHLFKWLAPVAGAVMAAMCLLIWGPALQVQDARPTGQAPSGVAPITKRASPAREPKLAVVQEARNETKARHAETRKHSHEVSEHTTDKVQDGIISPAPNKAYAASPTTGLTPIDVLVTDPESRHLGIYNRRATDASTGIHSPLAARPTTLRRSLQDAKITNDPSSDDPAPANIEKPATTLVQRSGTGGSAMLVARKAGELSFTAQNLGNLRAHDKRHLGVRRNLALIAMQKRDFRQARELLREILSIKPHDLEARGTLELVESLTRAN